MVTDKVGTVFENHLKPSADLKQICCDKAATHTNRNDKSSAKIVFKLAKSERGASSYECL